MRHPFYAAVLVLCFAAPAALAQPASAPTLTREQAAKLLEDYVQIWEDDARVNAATVAHFYAPQVNYYGKHMSRQQVLADKMRYVRAYPGRSYAITPGTANTSCDDQRTACVARAELVVRLTDTRGRSTQRITRLRLVMSQTAGGKIIEERASRQ